MKTAIKPITQQPTVDLYKKATGKSTAEIKDKERQRKDVLALTEKMANGDPKLAITKTAKRVLKKKIAQDKPVEHHDKKTKIKTDSGYPLPDPRTNRLDHKLKALRDGKGDVDIVELMNERAREYVRYSFVRFESDKDVDKQVRTDFATMGGKDRSIEFTQRKDFENMPSPAEWVAYKRVEKGNAK